ncbi:hypothetical protein [Acetobacter thailandicus]|uniref:hypothetical protein n=1 Tax=Acetobacter thailandicus TaxID=1502842 RepID=UPI001BA99C29|nr:hypothetical protein [Acetobacter thailandicus]MBS0959299.1 hypothetical protein [Acetobacter thailandicus]
MSVYLRAALALTCSLLAVQSATAAPVTTKTMPEWMLGEWVVTHVYQSKNVDRSNFDPSRFYPGKHLIVASGEIRLEDLGCEVASVTHSTGYFKKVFAEGVGGELPIEYSGLPKFPEKITYEKVKCSHRLNIFKENESSINPKPHIEKSIPTQWNIIVHSHTEIDLPFYSGSYLQLRKVTPATS